MYQHKINFLTLDISFTMQGLIGQKISILLRGQYVF